MSAITATTRPRRHTWGDTVTMLRRDLLHALRYPAVTISTIAVPVIMMLLFVFIFGGAIGASGGNGGLEYINYVVPGILMMTVDSGTLSTVVNISTDMQQGIINRFKTMAIGLGLGATKPEGANVATQPLQFGPFVSSAIQAVAGPSTSFGGLAQPCRQSRPELERGAVDLFLGQREPVARREGPPPAVPADRAAWPR